MEPYVTFGSQNNYSIKKIKKQLIVYIYLFSYLIRILKGHLLALYIYSGGLNNGHETKYSLCQYRIQTNTQRPNGLFLRNSLI